MKRKPQLSRMTGYRFEGWFDEKEVDRLLSEAVVNDVVAKGQYQAKMYADGGVVWFNGRPGAAMRALRDRVKGLIR